MMRRRSIMRDRKGAAAVEMALVTPLLLIIMFGSAEVGNYFYNEHLLTKAVRDGARYAARQNFSYYSTCTGTPTGTVEADTRNLVKTGYVTGTGDRLAAWNANTITLTTSCKATETATAPGSTQQNMTGIYRGSTTGAPIVTVAVTVPYTPIIGQAFGFSGSGLTLNATQQAAVTGL